MMSRRQLLTNLEESQKVQLGVEGRRWTMAPRAARVQCWPAMHGGSLGSRSGFMVAVLALGACQSIIGISGYEVEPSLDEDETGGDSSDGGGKSNGGSNV